MFPLWSHVMFAALLCCSAQAAQIPPSWRFLQASTLQFLSIIRHAHAYLLAPAYCKTYDLSPQTSCAPAASATGLQQPDRHKTCRPMLLLIWGSLLSAAAACFSLCQSILLHDPVWPTHARHPLISQEVVRMLCHFGLHCHCCDLHQVIFASAASCSIAKFEHHS